MKHKKRHPYGTLKLASTFAFYIRYLSATLMNNENQHFVPKSYLKNFCFKDSSKLYSSRFINHTKKWVSSSKEKHISSICYEEDIHDISARLAQEEGIQIDFIEKKMFWHEGDYLKNLIDKINSETLTQSNINMLPEFYLSMVVRNKALMHQYDPTKIKNIIDKSFIKLHEKTKELKTLSEDTYNWGKGWIKSLEEKFMSECNQQKMFSSQLYKQYSKNSPSYNTALSKLQGYKIMIGRVCDDDAYFVTSDFPGFSICDNGKVYSIKLENDAYHYMPISSKTVLGLFHPIYAFRMPEFSFVNLSREELNFINNGTVCGATEYIFCENETFLREMTEDINSKKSARR